MEQYIKDELSKAAKEISSLIEGLPENTKPYAVKEWLAGVVARLIMEKVEQEVKKSLGFYGIEQLGYILSKLDEKPEEKPVARRPAEPQEIYSIMPDVQPNPTLESSSKQSPTKGSKKPVLKRV